MMIVQLGFCIRLQYKFHHGTILSSIQYNIEFEYKGACPRGGGGGSSEEPSKPLSVGSILLIL